jgi:Virus neck protein
MATNFFFNNFKSSQEQLLLENLIIEAIKIYGEDMYYMPRKLGNFDRLYTADDQSHYEQAFMVEIYIKSVDGFAGDGNFMSKFGLEIRDQVVFSMAQRIFNQEIGENTNLVRPNEGDLIYFPLNKKCFQIKYVNKFEMFYQLGALQTWEMTCELFEYSDEIINTGIPEIDILQLTKSTNVLDYAIRDEQGMPLKDEDNNYIVMEQYNLESITGTGVNDTIQEESDTFIDFTHMDPFSEGQL